MPSSSNLLPLLVLLTLALALIGWFVVGWRRTRLSLSLYLLYLVNLTLARIWWGGRVSGKLPIRPGEGAVIICNHSSSVDPAFVQLGAGPRLVHWLVAKEYFSQPGFGQLLRLSQSIPVNRGSVDIGSTKLAMRYAQRGDLVGLFPEGKINTQPGTLLPGRSGAALIALRSRVKVIPCFIAGVPYTGAVISPFFSPGRVRLIVGKPIDLSPYYGREKQNGVLEEITRLFLVNLAALGGISDYVPEVRSPRKSVRPAPIAV